MNRNDEVKSDNQPMYDVGARADPLATLLGIGLTDRVHLHMGPLAGRFDYSSGPVRRP